MNENLFLKGFEKGMSGEKITAKEIKNIRFSKSQLFVQWQTESGNTCDECRNRDKMIFGIDEIESIVPFHYNCRCKFVALPSVTVGLSNICYTEVQKFLNTSFGVFQSKGRIGKLL